LIESKQAAGKFKRPPLVLVWMRLNRHPIDLIVFHDPFRKGLMVKWFSCLTLLSRKIGGGHDRFVAAQLFAPRIPPGRTLGRYPRLCGLLMTTGYSDVKVPKITPSPVGHENGKIQGYL